MVAVNGAVKPREKKTAKVTVKVLRKNAIIFILQQEQCILGHHMG